MRTKKKELKQEKNKKWKKHAEVDNDMFSNNRINMNYETVYATLDLKRFGDFFGQVEGLHHEWTSNLKVMFTVSYGNRVVYVHREKNIYIFNLLDYI